MSERTRYVVQFAVGTVIVVYAAFVFFSSRSITQAATYGTALATQVASASVMVAVAGLWLWDQWIWKWPLVQQIPGVSRCIAGTWRGSLDSQWVDPNTGKKNGEIEVYLCVRQRASSTYVTLYTEESRSKSFTAVVAKSDDDSWTLAEIYENRPRVALQEKSRAHWGAMVLEISGKQTSRILQGHYWTDRQTIGEIVFLDWRKEVADSFHFAENLFAGQGGQRIEIQPDNG